MNKKDLLMRILFFTGGIVLIAWGINLLIAANLGSDAWSVFHVGLTRHLPLTVGRAVQVTGTMFILLGWALGVPPTLGTFAQMYLCGIFIDLIKNLGLINPPKNLLWAWAYMLVGVVLFGVGNGIYLNAKLGSGPKDSILLGLARVTGASIRLIKTGMDLSAVIVGGILGGKVGIGTLIFALSIGPVLQWSIETIKRPCFKSCKTCGERA